MWFPRVCACVRVQARGGCSSASEREGARMRFEGNLIGEGANQTGEGTNLTGVSGLNRKVHHVCGSKSVVQSERERVLQ